MCLLKLWIWWDGYLDPCQRVLAFKLTRKLSLYLHLHLHLHLHHPILICRVRSCNQSAHSSISASCSAFDLSIARFTTALSIDHSIRIVCPHHLRFAKLGASSNRSKSTTTTPILHTKVHNGDSTINTTPPSNGPNPRRLHAPPNPRTSRPPLRPTSPPRLVLVFPMRLHSRRLSRRPFSLTPLPRRKCTSPSHLPARLVSLPQI